MILVIGGTGRLGLEAVRLLCASAVHRIRVLVRDPEKAAVLASRGVEIISGAITDTNSLGRAMRNVDRVFVIPPNIDNQAEVEGRIYRAAILAGVHHIVKLSTMKAEMNSACCFFKEHASAEEYLKRSGVEFTILRSNSFMQNLLWFAREINLRSTFSLPMGDAQTAPVDVRDVGAVAAAVLSEEIHGGVTYSITGPQKFSFADVAKELSTAMGREVKYRDVAPADFLAMLIRSGVPSWYARAVTAAWGVAREGKPTITDVVLKIARKKPITFEQFSRDYANAFVC
jgi:uncharacterized protein YbjT (DUF2867 family)